MVPTLPIAAYSTNGGSAFSAKLPLINKGTYEEQQNDQPELTYIGNVFFATWLDTASNSGKAEIFFTSGTVGNGVSSDTQLITSQSNVQPGSIVTLTGTGYLASSQVSFTFAGAPFGGSFPTNGTGAFTVQVQIPASTSAGTYYFTATDPAGNTASAEEVVELNEFFADRYLVSWELDTWIYTASKTWQADIF